MSWNIRSRGGGRCKAFFERDMEFIAGRSFTKQRKQLLQANDKLYEGTELHTKNIRFSPGHRYHQANTQDNDGQGKASGLKICLGRGI